jgi:PhnB protein
MNVAAYLNFDGRTEEAIQFYQKELGAELVMLMRFKDNPEPQPGMTPPNSDEKVMHSEFRIGESRIFASDMHCASQTKFQGFTLSIEVDTDDEAKRVFANLSQDGQVMMPLSKTFFASSFGSLTDKFGLAWMVIVKTAA